MKQSSKTSNASSNARRRAFFRGLMQASEKSWRRLEQDKADRAAWQGRLEDAVDHHRASER